MDILATPPGGFRKGSSSPSPSCWRSSRWFAIIDATMRPLLRSSRPGRRSDVAPDPDRHGLMCGPIGTVAAIDYLASVRPKLKAAA